MSTQNNPDASKLEELKASNLDLVKQLQSVNQENASLKKKLDEINAEADNLYEGNERFETAQDFVYDECDIGGLNRYMSKYWYVLFIIIVLIFFMFWMALINTEDPEKLKSVITLSLFGWAISLFLTYFVTRQLKRKLMCSDLRQI